MRADTPPVAAGGRNVAHPRDVGRWPRRPGSDDTATWLRIREAGVPDRPRWARRDDSRTAAVGPGRSQAVDPQRPVTVRGNRAPRCAARRGSLDSRPSGLDRSLRGSGCRTATLPDDHRTGVSRTGNRTGYLSGGVRDGRTVATTVSPGDAAGRAESSDPSIGLGRNSGQARRAPRSMLAPACGRDGGSGAGADRFRVTGNREATARIGGFFAANVRRGRRTGRSRRHARGENL